MAKTLKEIVYSILESIYEFRITDDSEMSFDFVAAKVNDVNSRLIEEMFYQGLNLDALYQKHCCVEVECEKVGCIINGELVPSGDVMWKATIPDINPKIGHKAISYLGLSDFANNFTRVSSSRFVSGAKLDWTRKTIYMVVGNQVYFKNLPTTGTTMLCMLGIFANPTDSCSYDDDTKYPTPDAYKLELLVKQDILSTFPRIPKDETSDSRDGIGQANIQQKAVKNE